MDGFKQPVRLGIHRHASFRVLRHRPVFGRGERLDLVQGLDQGFGQWLIRPLQYPGQRLNVIAVFGCGGQCIF